MALRWLVRRLLNSLRSLMMWRIARRCSSPLRRGVAGRGDRLAARAPWVEPGVAGDAARHDFPERGRELPGLLGADEARQRLLEELVRAETEECGHRIVCLQDFPLEIRHKHRVRSMLDQA